MRRGAGARGSLRGLVRVRLQPGDQFLQVVRRHSLLGDDQQRLAGQQRDRLEVVEQIVLQRVDRAVEHVRARIADAHRVAVGRCAHDAADADAAARAGHILDDDGLPERRSHAFRHDAPDRVRRAAGSERHEQRHGARRIGLRHCRAKAVDAEAGQHERKQHRSCGHGQPRSVHPAAHAGDARNTRSTIDFTTLQDRFARLAAPADVAAA